MDETDAEQIFQRFKRTKMRTEKVFGAGLGLKHYDVACQNDGREYYRAEPSE